MFRFPLVLAAFFAVLSGTAFAEEPTIVRHVEVRIDDLNLSDVNDAAILLQRLETAARKACGGSRPFGQNMHPAETALVRDYDKCRAAAMKQVLADLRSQILDKLYGPTDPGNTAVARR